MKWAVRHHARLGGSLPHRIIHWAEIKLLVALVLILTNSNAIERAWFEHIFNWLSSLFYAMEVVQVFSNKVIEASVLFEVLGGSWIAEIGTQLDLKTRRIKFEQRKRLHGVSIEVQNVPASDVFKLAWKPVIFFPLLRLLGVDSRVEWALRIVLWVIWLVQPCHAYNLILVWFQVTPDIYLNRVILVPFTLDNLLNWQLNAEVTQPNIC